LSLPDVSKRLECPLARHHESRAIRGAVIRAELSRTLPFGEGHRILRDKPCFVVPGKIPLMSEDLQAPEPAWRPLSKIQRRVLGVLI